MRPRQIYEVEKYIENYPVRRRTFFVHPDLKYLVDDINFGFEVVDIIVSDSFPKFEWVWYPPQDEPLFSYGDDFSIWGCLNLGTISFTNFYWIKTKQSPPKKNYSFCDHRWEKKLPTKYDTPIVTELSSTKVLVVP